MNRIRPYLCPALMGGVLAAAVLWLLCFFIASIDLFGGSFDLADTLYRMELATDEAYHFFGSRALAAAWQVTTVFLLGAAAGVATVPFAQEGGALLKQSVCHFLITGVLAVAAGWFVLSPWTVLALYVPLYLLIWAGRWVGWYLELADLRAQLGLFAAPSPLKWRETLPYLPFALCAGVLVPLVLRLLDAPDVPVLSQVLYPYLMLPAACFCAGVSLGRRQGLCPLFPLLCAGCWMPTAGCWLAFSPLLHGSFAALSALGGLLLGTHVRKKKEG